MTCKIYTVDGKVLYSVSDNFKAGENRILLNAEEIGKKGMFIYEISSQGFSDTKRMIVVE